MAAQLAGIPCPHDRRMLGSSKDRAIVRSQARAPLAEIEAARTQALQQEIEAAQTRATPQQTALVQMPARVRAMSVRTAAEVETILVTGRFQKPTRRGTPARSEDPRTEPPRKQTVRAVRPVCAAVRSAGRVAAAVVVHAAVVVAVPMAAVTDSSRGFIPALNDS